ncbi:carboxylesterase 5A-like [Branchiostoma floridae]|uniref:Carboxylesterase 5A-like n=1 Tax=Branchiostoma floridae TaxID=7739 RepID=A0A9J7LBP4_BRAFL|nr:carboxylesterase 5A-like [Branchiostoma floridae]
MPEDVPVVTTETGKLRGTVTFATDLHDRPVYTFLGVPYATPPENELRFQAPLPAQPWTDERDAAQYGPHCAQDIDLMFSKFYPVRPPHNTTSEDCLYLNVFTTTLESQGTGLPALVWFHGGGLSFGTGALYPGTALAAHQDLVVVTVNYRLGPFGFLSTGDNLSPGNYGLLDQVEALKWVHDNIQSFGGDPGSVTVAGQFGGGASVSYHLLSQASSGLFHRAISQSGVATSFPHAEFNKPHNEFVSQAKSVGCKRFAKKTEKILECLRSTETEDLVKSRKGEILSRCLPCTDGAFLKDSPRNLLKKGEFSKVDYMLGVNSAEFGHVLPSLMSTEFGKGKSLKEVTTILIGYANILYGGAQRLPEMHEELINEYLSELSRDPREVEKIFTDLQSDTLFIAPTTDMADRMAAAGANVYLYEFRHRLSRHRWGTKSSGAEHGDEMPLLFGAPFMTFTDPNNAGNELSFTEEEKSLSLDMMAYWANFVRTGDPSNPVGATDTGSRDLPTWPAYTPDVSAYLKLDVTSSADVGLRRRQVTLWNKVLPEMADDDATQDNDPKDEL